MNSISLLQQGVEIAHQFLEGTMADVTEAQLHWSPPGNANALGATYAHVVLSEDMIINGMLQGKPPLFASSWAGKAGVSEPMPQPGPEWEKYGAWAKNVRVDLAALRAYAQAVYKNTEAYLASLTEGDLDRTVDLSVAGMGQVNVAWILNGLIIAHASNICGEISCLKGIQGARGYPF
jgi:DinB superfamily